VAGRAPILRGAHEAWGQAWAPAVAGARLALALRVYLQGERREFPSVSAEEASQPGFSYTSQFQVGLTEQKPDIIGMRALHKRRSGLKRHHHSPSARAAPESEPGMSRRATRVLDSCNATKRMATDGCACAETPGALHAREEHKACTWGCTVTAAVSGDGPQEKDKVIFQWRETDAQA
jgi:hypothetical protein